MCPEASTLAILQQKITEEFIKWTKNFQLNKIPFGQMNVINKKMEMYLFLFVPSTCRWNQILACDWLIFYWCLFFFRARP